jgi:hypothetical protein
LSSPSSSFLNMGRETYRIPLALFQENRTKLVDRLEDGHVVFLIGGKATTRYDSDHEPIFRQESYFYYLTGVKEQGTRLRSFYRYDYGSNDALHSQTSYGLCDYYGQD